MAVITRRIKVNDKIELSTFYTLDSAHDVVCIDIKSQGEGGLGHISMHMQLSRYVVQELIEALVDTLEGIADPPYYPLDEAMDEQAEENAKADMPALRARKADQDDE